MSTAHLHRVVPSPNRACRYYARVVQVFPPRPTTAQSPANGQASSSSSTTSDEEALPIHKVAEDLTVPIKEANDRDDPERYYYKVQILEEDKSGPGKANEKTKGKEVPKSKYSGSLMDVRCVDMRFVHLSILRPFALLNLSICYAAVIVCLSPSLFSVVSYASVLTAMLRLHHHGL